MSENIIKPRCLIVGAYPQNKIYGGFVRDCESLKKSRLYSDYKVFEFDSSQKGNPPPPLALRIWFSLSRISRYLKVAMGKKHEVALILFPSGLGALEKLLVGTVLLKLKRVGKVVFLPRAGVWNEQLLRYPRVLSKFVFISEAYWFCQGQKTISAIEAINDRASTHMMYPLLDIATHSKEPIHDVNTIEFIFVGWLEPEKGVREVLSAISRVNENFVFHIVGAGTLANEVQRHAALDDRIIFHGWLNKDQLFELYAHTHCAVLPSYSEGFSNFIAEAMCFGMPVIATNVGDMASILVDDNLLSPRDVDGLVDHMKIILCDREERFRQSTRNLSNAQKFGVKAFDDMLRSIGV